MISDPNVLILGVRRLPNETASVFAGRVEELTGLCEAAGGIVAEVFVQERDRPDTALYLGKGKIEEMRLSVRRHEARLAIFDSELSPGQIRNLETALDCRVLDRTQLILDIFAQRAKSREGLLQVEIAQLQYLLPRLTGRGIEMSRLGGGIGTRGPGETKLETDRRRIRQRIDTIREQLQRIRRTRDTQRQQRSRSVPVVALVGYTNSGKTTLLSRWTADRGTTADGQGHDRLFDTLDPVARRVRTKGSAELVVLDTVGFVRDLPHLLVDAFRATLEEVTVADLIVHVVDGADDPVHRIRTTYQVLHDLGALDKPVITFFNKMDRAEQPPGPDTNAIASIYGSVLHQQGIDALYEAVEKHLALDSVVVEVTGPTGSKTFWNTIHKLAVVQSVVETEESGQARLRLTTERRIVPRLVRQIQGLGDYRIVLEGGGADDVRIPSR